MFTEITMMCIKTFTGNCTTHVLNKMMSRAADRKIADLIPEFLLWSREMINRS